jgi:protein ImuB
MTQGAAQREAWAWAFTAFSPEVYVLDIGVALDGAAVQRYWGGWRPWWARVRAHVQAWAHAAQHRLPSRAGGATVWQARARALTGAHTAVDDLPLWTLPHSARQQAVWADLGMRSWADLRRLPRGSVARRWGRAVVQALDEAYGEAAHRLTPLVVPEHFDVRIDMTPVERVAGLSAVVDDLLGRLVAWLQLRQQWAQTLRWTLHLDVPQLQVQQGRAAQQCVEVSSAEASADLGLWRALMREHMTQWRLSAPVIAVQLSLLRGQIADDHNRGLWDGPRGVSLGVCLDRVKARWGGQGVALPRLRADRLPERMQDWQSHLPERPSAAAPVADEAWLLPPWLLHEPLALWVKDERPWYQGPLRLVLGPQRLDAMPWAADWAQAPRAQRRDYFIARSAQAGWLWVFREHAQADDAQVRWFLHGVYG